MASWILIAIWYQVLKINKKEIKLERVHENTFLYFIIDVYMY